MSLRGKSVVVTGSTRGIGKVTAIHLAKIGARVAVVGRNTARAEKVVSEITEAGDQAEFFPCDLTVEEQVAALFDDIHRRYGSVDVVVNNAAATDTPSGGCSVVEHTTEELERFIRSNVYSAFFSFKYGIPAMLPSGGAFVTISSIEGLMPRPGELGYATSKSAVCSLSRQVAVEYGNQGIRSNTLVLGFIETNATRPLLEDPRIGDSVRAATGGQPPTSLDVARAVAFFASDSAGGFNGATLILDRGMTVTSHVPGDLTITGDG